MNWIKKGKKRGNVLHSTLGVLTSTEKRNESHYIGLHGENKCTETTAFTDLPEVTAISSAAFSNVNTKTVLPVYL